MFKRVNSDVVPFSINSPAGNRYAFGTTDVSNDIDVNYNENIKKGFGTGPNEFPELEDFNALMFTGSYFAAYLYQEGIPEWNDKQKYYVNGITKVNGVLYKSLTGTEETPNVDNNPTLAGSLSWALFLPDRIGMIDYGYVAKPYHIVAFGGEFNRADYPKLWAYLQANPSLVKTQAQWQSEATANGGICGFFSDGNGTTTFRVPNLDKAFLRPDSRGVGSYQSDAIREIKGTILSRSNVSLPGTITGGDGAFTYEPRSVPSGSSGVVYDSSTINVDKTIFKASNVVPTASENRTKNIAVLPLIVAK